MYIVYYNDKTLLFDAEARCQNSLRLDGRTVVSTDIAKLLQIIGNSDTVEIISDDFESVFDTFRAQFVEVNAAGGVVEDDCGRTMMIRRRGRWDLPKGHREDGESFEQCAAREVCEECGLDAVETGGEICRTLHFYDTYGRWELKRTVWFAMRYRGTAAAAPQAEEDITAAEWCDRATARQRAAESFPTIRYVIDKTIKPEL